MQVNNKYFTKCKGSLTVETTLIISVVIFLLFVLIFSFMIMYQKAVLEKTASMVAQQGAEIWVDSHKQINNGYWDLDKDKDSIYYRLFDDSLFTGKKYSITINNSAQLGELLFEGKEIEDIQEQKFTKMKRLIFSELNKGILKPSRTIVEISFINVQERKIEVSLTQDIKIPLGFLVKLIDKKGSLELNCKGAAVVTEPAESIRNIDFAIEYARKVRETIDINAFIEKLKGNK